MITTNVRTPSEVAPTRLSALATLPVFMILTGKRAVIAGGTAAAAWKAELLAAAGADVAIHATDPSEDMVLLVARGAAAGSLSLHAAPWCAADLDGAAIAICDAESDEEAAAFAAAARAAGIPVNVIDKPAFCTFQFGSIINRSPVVVGVSTDGAAPILGQAIRRRIETLLPAALADWARLAAGVRSRVMDRFAPGRPRRAFWEAFAERAFREAAPETVDDLLGAGASDDTRGKVTLVGAGPGDSGLLTLNAVRALQASDVILFDDLVSDDVLELARREAKRICVGKRGARASCKQEDITALMISLARSGRNVVRLKCGDPMVFGRAGEEIDAVRAAGLEVSVVPGITTASAMASAFQTSLTHRDHAQVVSFATGHSRDGVLPPGLDIQAIVGEGRTGVFYMGARTADAIVARAIAGGLDPTTPAVVIASVSRPEERRWAGPVAALPATIAAWGTDAPIALAIGTVFANAETGALTLADPAPARRAAVRA
ncbi:siroheme synthase CysG [Acuticoccus kandeliae]|uniref:siroheme synthase CysG n=1 Tax=Acuticoccus kandeliae TaxID=2073160 RepID=UPI000D3E713A|nr:siroheme synthase CysG [Acuticoccus kandeliae]